MSSGEGAELQEGDRGETTEEDGDDPPDAAKLLHLFVGRITKSAAAGAQPTWSVWMAIPTAVATAAARAEPYSVATANAERSSGDRWPGLASPRLGIQHDDEVGER